MLDPGFVRVTCHYDPKAGSDRVDIQVEEIRINSTSSLVGKTMMESPIRKDFDLITIVIRKPDEQMLFNPKADTIIEAGDVMVVVGSAKNIKQLDRLS